MLSLYVYDDQLLYIYHNFFSLSHESVTTLSLLPDKTKTLM